ncbi:MAG: TSUP family transporter [Clostridia bacterium]|nr:TSUP family transporter [Clostridia bacterium]
MIYFLLSAIGAFFGIGAGIGATTLLRPLLDAIAPLSPASISLLCAMAALCAALVSAFFALGQPLPLHPDELLLLAIGSALGGILGDLADARLCMMIPHSGVTLLKNALLFTLLALAAIYFKALSPRIRPLAITRLSSFPVSLVIGLIAAFLAFGAEPVTLAAYFLLFDAENDEASVAALTVSLFSMTGKLVTAFIRLRMRLPDAEVLLWLLPGALLGAIAATLLPALHRRLRNSPDLLLRLSLFTSLINMAAALT